jgi:RNA polymerase sigma-70 factor (ECF subfamily)
VLIARVLEGEQESFAALVMRYEGALLKLAKNRLGRRDWAEDAVQEAFLCAYRWLGTYDSRYSFRTWLWTILLNQCNRQYHRRSRQPQVGILGTVKPAPEALLSQESSPPESLLAKERAEQLGEQLATLPDEQADALRLRFFGGLKFAEIAQVQGCSLTSAKNRVRWGLTKLAARLGPSPVAPG